jgi:methylase of polypeptide subunit release factors
MLMTPGRERLLDELATRFGDEGIEALMLRGPNLGVEAGTVHEGEPWRAPDFEIGSHGSGELHSAQRHAGHEMVLLVRREDAPASRRILEGTGWRFELGDRWPWRIFRTAAYLYDDRLGIDLMWGIPGAPFPLPRLPSLERELWAGTARGSHGFLEPEPEPLVVFLATQAARLHIRGAHRYASWTQDLAVCAEHVRSWQRVWDIARATHTEDSVRRGLGLADISGAPDHGSAREGLGTRSSWLGAEVLIRRGRPRQIRGFAAAAPRLGTVTARVKFGGIVLEVGRDVFVPRGLAESLAVEAVRVLGTGSPGVMVDVGTGCGPVALAVASEAPSVEIHATETSRRALFWAGRNRRRLDASRVHLHRGSLLDPLPERLRGRVRVMTANVPYVPLEQWQDGWRGRESQVVGPDPDGLGLYRSLARQARGFLTADGRMIIQLQTHQWEDFAEELRSLGYRPGEVLLRWGTDMTVWAEVAGSP